MQHSSQLNARLNQIEANHTFHDYLNFQTSIHGIFSSQSKFAMREWNTCLFVLVGIISITIPWQLTIPTTWWRAQHAQEVKSPWTIRYEIRSLTQLFVLGIRDRVHLLRTWKYFQTGVKRDLIKRQSKFIIQHQILFPLCEAQESG